jgi:hypothetical protein
MRAEKNKDDSLESAISVVHRSQTPPFSNLYKGLSNSFKLPYRCFALLLTQRNLRSVDSDLKHAPDNRQYQTI